MTDHAQNQAAMPPLDCPTADQMRKLLHGELEAALEAEVDRHLGICPDCRDLLENLSNQETTSQPWVAHLSDLHALGPTDPAIVPAVGFLKDLRTAFREQVADAAADGALAQDLEDWRAAVFRDASDAPSPRPIITVEDGKPFHVGRLVLLRPLGIGGMGDVFEGYDPQLQRKVAVKFLSLAAVARTERRDRFLREVAILARLRHANIVQIHDAGEHQGLPYLVMEFVEGGTLADLLRQSPLEPREAAQLTAMLADAVQHAHSQGVLHRDLKPANVLLTSTPSPNAVPQAAGQRHDAAEPVAGARCLPKITDFGLAKFLDGTQHLTRSGMALGTPSYMAPEQVQADLGHVGVATDVYGLGTILYEMLTGRPPYKGGSAVETMMQVIHHELAWPRRLRPEVPLDLENICLKCLDKKPSQRYVTAANLRLDLERFLDGRPILARRASRVDRLWRWCKRRPLEAGLSTALVLLVLLGLAVVTGLWLNARRGWEHAEAQRHRAAVNAEIAREAASRAASNEQAALLEAERAEQNSYISMLDRAAHWWNYADVTRARGLLVACQPRPPAYIDRRNWAWYYLWGVCHSNLWSAHVAGPRTFQLAISPDGALVACAYGSTEDHAPAMLQLLDPGTGKLLAAWPCHQGRIVALAWLSPHELMAVNDDLTVRVWNVAGPTPRLIRALNHPGETVTPHGLEQGCALDASGQCCLRREADGSLRFWNLASGEARFLSHHKGVVAFALTLDGKQAATSGTDDTVRLWDTSTATSLHAWDITGPRTIAFTPDGRHLAAVSDKDLRLWNIATRQLDWTMPLEQGQEVSALKFSPDGAWVLVYRRPVGGEHADRQMQVWRTKDGMGGHKIVGHAGLTNAVAFSPDGRWLATASQDRTVRLWRLADGVELAVYRGHASSVDTLTLTPDGRQLVSASQDGEIKVWDLARRQEYQRASAWPSDGDSFGHLTFLPDGRLLAVSAKHGLCAFDPTTCNLVEKRSLFFRDSTGSEGQDIALSRDGRWLAGPEEKRKLLHVRDSRTGDVRQTFGPFDRPLGTVVFSHDGTRLAAVEAVEHGKKPQAPYRVWVWDLAAGRLLHEADLPWPVASLVFSPDGQQLGLGRFQDNDSPIPWLTIGAPVPQEWTADMNELAHAVTLSPNGRWLAAANWKTRQVLVWELAPGGVRRWLPAGRVITGLAFTFDSQRLALTGPDGSVSLWTLASGEEILVLHGPQGRLEDYMFPARVAFSPDDRYLAVNAWDNAIVIWEAVPKGSTAADLHAEWCRRVSLSAFRFHLEAVKELWGQPESWAMGFHLAQLHRLEPPTAALRAEWDALGKQLGKTNQP